MKSLPFYPRDKCWHCNEACYDQSEDFPLFLVETRKNEFKSHKREKSWKRSLSFSWWKSDNKSSDKKEEQKKMNCSHSGASTLLRRSFRQLVSEPIVAWLAQTKEGETETPYMCLGSRNHPTCSHAFGPIYLVT